MTIENDEPEVKDVERVEVEPAGGPNVDDETETTEPESSQDENASDDDEEVADDTDTTKKPELVKRPAPVKPEAQGDEIKDVEGETPRERALRLEVTRLKHLQRQDRNNEIVGAAPAPAKQEVSPEKKAVLSKYKPEEIASLREVIDVMADEMGFVKKDQLSTQNYVEQSNAELNGFLDKHPEYLPENDKDGVLWDAFKAEYALYKQPSNPKDFKTIFDKIHREIFNIKPAGDLSKVNAQKEKIKVASHSGASSKSSTQQAQRSASPSGLRLDALKGFSQEELDELGE